MAKLKPVAERVGDAGWLVSVGETVIVVWGDGTSVALVQVQGKPRARLSTVALALARLVSSRVRERVPDTASERVLAQIRPNGRVFGETAVEAFSVLSHMPG